MMGTPDRTTAWINFAQRSRDEGGLGLAPHQAAGLVGNLVNESGQDLNPWGPSGDNGSAWGTAQWRGDRLARLQQRPDYRTMEGQQAFMRAEMDGPEAASYEALRAARTPEEAASAVNKYYERSADTSGHRERAAHDLMAQFGPDASPGALTSSYAEGNKSMPALSADNTLGQGALNQAEPTANILGDAMQGIGASLASISNPDQAKAITAQMVASQKAATDKGTWAIQTLPDGTSFYINNKTRQTIPLGNHAKPEADKYVEAAKTASAKSNQELGDTINQASRDSASLGQSVADIRAAISDPNLKQGIDGPARQFLNKIYAATGYGDKASDEAAANGDIASALSHKLALQLVNAGGTKLLPGSFSDSDRKFVEQMATSLSNTHEANMRLLDIYDRANKYVQQAEALRAQHVSANDGIIMPSFRQELSDLSNKQLKEAQDEAAKAAALPRTATPSATTTAPAVNTFKTKSGKTINWSF